MTRLHTIDKFEGEGKMFLNEDDLKIIKTIEDIEEIDFTYDDFLITETFLFTPQEDY